MARGGAGYDYTHLSEQVVLDNREAALLVHLLQRLRVPVAIHTLSRSTQ
jgi:hypothetical protein